MIRRNRPETLAGLRHVAVLTMLAFGCATVRVPASTMAADVPVRGGVAEPQLELWLESGQEVSPAESAQATAEARAALGSALAGVSSPQGDSVLVVRAQGVARTSSRRSDQRAAKVGLVVGAVVVVAAVVAILVASKGRSGGGFPHAVARAPRAARPAVPAPRLVPHAGHAPRWPAIDVNVFAGIDVSPGAPAQGQPAPEVAVWDGPAQRWVAPPPASAPPEQLISLPPPPPLELGDRGFFTGDTLRLELVVVDRRDGTPRWTKVVDGNVDPRDAGAVRRLLDRALQEEDGWTSATW